MLSRRELYSEVRDTVVARRAEMDLCRGISGLSNPPVELLSEPTVNRESTDERSDVIVRRLELATSDMGAFNAASIDCIIRLLDVDARLSEDAAESGLDKVSDVLFLRGVDAIEFDLFISVRGLLMFGWPSSGAEASGRESRGLELPTSVKGALSTLRILCFVHLLESEDLRDAGRVASCLWLDAELFCGVDGMESECLTSGRGLLILGVPCALDVMFC